MRLRLLQSLSYLLLVDDIWSAAIWEQIKNSLPRSEKGSRVIVTTRFQAVASACRTGKGDRVHELGVFSMEKARELFLRVVAKNRLAEKNQQKIPSVIWELCRGLPLVIATMAGHVACNPGISMIEWDVLCRSLMPLDVEIFAQERNKRILNHCYNDMPAEIKTCSLFLSIYPEGRKVNRKRLIRRWIAEGSVFEKPGLSAEEVAEAYFNHLIRRNIIRAVEHSSNGKVKSYQVHDMVLDCIVSNASQENFVTVVGGQELMPTSSSKPRRLSLQGGYTRHGNAMKRMNLSHVRSVTVFGSLKQLESNSFGFGIVQVLDLEDCKDFKNRHLAAICKMLLLKYLNLRKTDIKCLPSGIAELRYLETLDIRETNVTDLPRSFCQLKRLVNILAGNKRTRKALTLPRGMKNNVLRILSGIKIVEAPTAVADLHHLTDLRKLAIYKLNIKKEGKLFQELRSSIQYLVGYSLCSLVIHDDSSEFIKPMGSLSSPFLNALELSGKLVELPRWIIQLDALTKLTLSVTVLASDTLGHLSQLMKLFSLTFSLAVSMQDQQTATMIEDNKAQSNGEIQFPVGGFVSLKLLRFFAPSLPPLRFPENAVPNLERLELRFNVLEGLFGIGNPEALEEVHLGVHSEAGEATKSVVQDVATAARGSDKGPRVIVHQSHG